jgi:methylenetetrahydrofolate dehydrogenase (NADP+) / methenyltetrahydrofolate cyclohydrolase
MILDGKKVRDEILEELRPRVATLAATQRAPGLAVVLIGDDPASHVYVSNKVQACEKLGFHSRLLKHATTIKQAELMAIVRQLNADPLVDGILVQMPLPAHLDEKEVLLAIDPQKDVDGFHPHNVGLLVANLPGLRACTPSGVMELLRRYQIDVAGKHAVVVGRSDIVGKPMSLLLLHANVTVTICNSRTANLAEHCRRADILVAAIGRAEFLGRDHIRKGAVVIDVGMNRVDGKLRGDVAASAAHELASFYTPVPGGVGPLTIAMLMSNTVSSAERRLL